MPRGFGSETILGFTLSPMTDLPEPQSAADHYETAVEASCDTLIILQMISASAMGSSADVAAVRGQIATAIESQRRAIAELRLASTESGNAPVTGFVLAAGYHVPPHAAP